MFLLSQEVLWMSKVEWRAWGIAVPPRFDSPVPQIPSCPHERVNPGGGNPGVSWVASQSRWRMSGEQAGCWDWHFCLSPTRLTAPKVGWFLQGKELELPPSQDLFARSFLSSLVSVPVGTKA